MEALVCIIEASSAIDAAKQIKLAGYNYGEETPRHTSWT
jgi:hypothetical protein